MKWDIQEFNRLCDINGLPSTDIYIITLHSKIWRAENFANKAEKVWQQLFASHDELSTADVEWRYCWFESEAYAEAALQALHSTADVLAQIINCIILGGHFSEDKVSLYRVLNKLKTDTIAPDVEKAIEEFSTMKEFKYVDGFVNTTKHRRLINAEFRTESGVDTGFREGLRFRPFEYKQERFQEEWISNIRQTVIPMTIEGLEKIGISINDYMK